MLTKQERYFSKWVSVTVGKHLPEENKAEWIATLRYENVLNLWSPAGNNSEKIGFSVHKHSLGTGGLERCNTTTNSENCSLIALQTRLAKT